MRTIFFLTVLMALAACSDSDSDTLSVEVSVIESETKSIGAEGGEISVGEMVISIPASAVSEDVDITVEELSTTELSEYELASPVYRFSPAGLVFDVPVEVELPIDDIGDFGPLTVYWTLPNSDVYEAVPTVIEGGIATATVTHFSSGFVGSSTVDVDGDGFSSPEDCDDSDAAVNPTATEQTYDGVDNDCDPSTLDDDLDQDGYLLADDCDDANALMNPGLAEVPLDGFDNDCDPSTSDAEPGVNPTDTGEALCEFVIDMNVDTQWPVELSWSVTTVGGAIFGSGSGYTANGSNVSTISLPPGEYLVNMVDSYGDGWDGSTITVSDGSGNTVVTGGLSTGSSDVLGMEVNEDCTTAEVPTGDWGDTYILPTDTYPAPTDVSWIVCSVGVDMNVDTPAPGHLYWSVTTTGDNMFWGSGSGYTTNGSHVSSLSLPPGEYLVNMADSQGDGWDDSTITVSDGSGNIVVTGGLPTGSSDYLVFEVNEDCTTAEALDTAWFVDEAQYGCPTLFEVTSGFDGYDMSFEVVNAAGDVVYASAGEYPGNFPPNMTTNVVAALPSGDYTVNLSDAGGFSWSSSALIRVYDSEGNWRGEGTIPSGSSGTDSFTMSLSCDSDTDVWVEPTGDLWDTGWSQGAPWLDTYVPDFCGHVLEWQTLPNSFGLGFTLTDSTGTIVAEAASTTIPTSTLNRWTASLGTGVYELTMTDSNGFRSILPFNIYDASGNLVQSVAMLTDGSHTETITLTCEEDTAGEIVWDSGTVLPPAEGVGCPVLFRLNAVTWGNEMMYSIATASGQAFYFSGEAYPTNFVNHSTNDNVIPLPSGEYIVGMIDTYGDGWNGGGSIQVFSEDGALLNSGVLPSGGYDEIIIQVTCDSDTGVSIESTGSL